ncbi:MAG: class I SAM-dependent methyltransferase [Gammaproteobacteria bacterium]
MFNSDTDSEWEKYGQDDPYFGVISYDKFRQSSLTDENKEEFFRSGSVYIDDVLKKIRLHIAPAFTIKQALDFGCGVGRLVIPLSDVSETVTGVDVSDSMLNEARKNCDARSIRNVVLVKSDDRLSLLKDKYDFIHSFIVFQHIPVKRGEHLFESLIARLEDEGVGVIHFTYARNYASDKWVPWIKSYVPLAKNLINVLKGRKFFAPEMQMNTYDLNRLLFIMQRAGVCEFHAEYTNHGGELGVVLLFRKQKKA